MKKFCLNCAAEHKHQKYMGKIKNIMGINGDMMKNKIICIIDKLIDEFMFDANFTGRWSTKR